MRGLIHIYCGDGKGKTTAAIGLTIRCAAYDRKIIFAQFLKDGTSGECKILKTLPQVQYLQAHPCQKFASRMNESERECTAKAIQALFTETIALAQDADLLVLDEVMAALHCDFLTVEQVEAYLQKKPEQLEVVLTGRYPPLELMECADYISEIQSVKHPYEKGIPAREGIER